MAISAQKLTELKKQMAAERAENSRLKSEIRMLDELIGKTREPQTTLIHTIRDKQVRIQQLADDLELAEQQLRYTILLLYYLNNFNITADKWKPINQRC